MARAIRKLLPLIVLACGCAIADDSGDRAKLIGSWRSQENSGASWILQNAGQGMHLTAIEDNRKLSDFECNTAGRECTVKGEGGAMKVSMWYNGPKLVVMETRGSQVVKHRFQAVADDKMQIEVIPIVPQGKTELLNFVRAQSPGPNQ